MISNFQKTFHHLCYNTSRLYYIKRIKGSDFLKILIINGPNLNMLGIREPTIYGRETLATLNEKIEKKAQTLGISVSFFQSNHEGFIIDEIQKAFNQIEGIIINPGAFTHYSYAIRDALSAVNIPTVEVHLSDVQDREDFRKISVVKEVCVNTFYGEGLTSYLKALDFLWNTLKQKPRH